ncbi:MAG: tyrosine--tRNA ligase [Kiritimatiellae bacterium]|nr:tyrosine--tRNA ligase [Kiritimatiellia bacterium]
MENIITVLTSRGLVEDITNPNLNDVVNEPITVYAGFDPTADSLQVGNLVTVMALAHFQRCGHKVIALAGGATGMIGDPSGKSDERVLLDQEQIEVNVTGIKENLSRFLDFENETAPALIVNNYDWLQKFSFIDFLRDVGKSFRVGSMLGKESVRARLESDAGMSFTEFSYQLLQAYDFLHLYDAEKCVLQIGGSDQWGNITAGIDLVHKRRGGQTYGLSIPLVLDSSGQKFGKSAGNAVFLTASKTSVYDFYQFFIRTADDKVVELLKIFTFLSLDDIAELEQSLKTAPEQRAAQKKLAEEVTLLVHGENGLRIAKSATDVLFGKSMEGLCAEDLLEVFADVTSTELQSEEVEGATALDLAVAAGLCKSKGQARRLIESGGLYVNNNRVPNLERVIEADDIIDSKLVVLRSGKRNFHLVKV